MDLGVVFYSEILAVPARLFSFVVVGGRWRRGRRGDSPFRRPTVLPPPTLQHLIYRGKTKLRFAGDAGLLLCIPLPELTSYRTLDHSAILLHLYPGVNVVDKIFFKARGEKFFLSSMTPFYRCSLNGSGSRKIRYEVFSTHSQLHTTANLNCLRQGDMGKTGIKGAGGGS